MVQPPWGQSLTLAFSSCQQSPQRRQFPEGVHWVLPRPGPQVHPRSCRLLVLPGWGGIGWDMQLPPLSLALPHASGLQGKEHTFCGSVFTLLSLKCFSANAEHRIIVLISKSSTRQLGKRHIPSRGDFHSSYGHIFSSSFLGWKYLTRSDCPSG